MPNNEGGGIKVILTVHGIAESCGYLRLNAYLRPGIKAKIVELLNVPKSSVMAYFPNENTQDSGFEASQDNVLAIVDICESLVINDELAKNIVDQVGGIVKRFSKENVYCMIRSFKTLGSWSSSAK